MRRIRSIAYCIVASVILCGSLAPAALAGKMDDCGRPPPAWWTAPPKNTVTVTYGAGYSRAASHEYSAQRRTYRAPPRYTAPQPRYYRDPFARR